MKLNIRFSISVFAGLALAVALLWLLAGWQPAAHAAAMKVPVVQAKTAADFPEFLLRTVDEGDGEVGDYSSMKLNAAGNPVIAYFDYTHGAVKVAVCGDSTCTSVTSTIVDDGGLYDEAHPDREIGWDPSLALDAAGNPVISYYYFSGEFDSSDNALKVAVCEDNYCTSVFSTTVDSGNVGRYSSLVLNDAGNPVIAYYDDAHSDLKLVVCGNKTCASTTINTVDSEGWAGGHPNSLVLNAAGNPVIGYHANDAVKVAVCPDPTCTGTPSINTVHKDDVEGALSMVLDADENPVFSYSYYSDFPDVTLMLAVCEDTACTSAITTTVDSSAWTVGRENSLALNAAGNPVISYVAAVDGVDQHYLKVAVCGDATCTSTSVFSTTVDSEGDTGFESSLALDANGNPVISYREADYDDLRFVKCGNAICSDGNIITIVDRGTTDVGLFTSLALNSNGYPVISYYDNTYDNLELAVCKDITCTSASLITVDAAWDVGWDNSLALDANDNPIISYHNWTGGFLETATCGDITCTNVVKTPVDWQGRVGRYTSLALNANGYPVISYYDWSNYDLKLAVCGDTACTSVISTTLDSAGDVGWFTSLALGDSDNPIISYYDVTHGDLKLAVCEDANCTHVITTTVDADGNAGGYTSLALNSNGYPVISYAAVISDSGETRGVLKVAACGDVICTNTSVISTVVDSPGAGGWHTSLELDANDNPIISYYDVANGNLKLAMCEDTTCTSVISGTVDSAGDVGWYTSLELDADDNPIISYYDVTHGNLKLAFALPPLLPLSNLYLPLLMR